MCSKNGSDPRLYYNKNSCWNYFRRWGIDCLILALCFWYTTVSYTHLDVYKRQVQTWVTAVFGTHLETNSAEHDHALCFVHIYWRSYTNAKKTENMDFLFLCRLPPLLSAAAPNTLIDACHNHCLFFIHEIFLHRSPVFSLSSMTSCSIFIFHFSRCILNNQSFPFLF